jgi:ADP-dependent NAD(P)H-hydrate dehydratase / NAD(P)H-hydrate epimerase
MVKILGGAAMREADRRTSEEYGLPGAVLMETAGLRVVEFIITRLKHEGSIVVLAGPGNNGGDGFVIARLLKRAGYDVTVWSTNKQGTYRGDAAINEKYYLKEGYSIKRLVGKVELDQFKQELQGTGLVVDALLGTGVDREVAGLTAEVVQAVNMAPVSVLSVDIPSGVNADTGELLGCAVKADWTVTFACPKLGLMFYPGAGQVGEMIIADINIPESLMEKANVELLNLPLIRSYFTQRSGDAHKGSLGRALIVAGSPGMTGAAVLTAQAALKGGCGLVYLAAPESICPILEAKLIEVIVIPLPESSRGIISPAAASQIIDKANDCDVLAIGPGLDTGEITAELIYKLVQLSPVPLVLDAGALAALGSDMNMLRAARHLPVLTPHPGEMARLAGISTKQVQSRRLEIAQKNAGFWNCNIILKGPNTVIANPKGQAAINPTGNVSLATAGSGDLLTGLTTSFIAQGMNSENAARAGAFVHGMAGDLLPPGRGYSALDILARFREAFELLEQTEDHFSGNPYLVDVKPVKYRGGFQNA